MSLSSIFIFFWIVMVFLGLLAFHSNNGEATAKAWRLTVNCSILALVLDGLWVFLMFVRITPISSCISQKAWDWIFWNISAPWIGPQILIIIGIGIYLSRTTRPRNP